MVRSTYGQLNIAKYPIGLDSRVEDLNTLLRIGMNDITLMIGIYGIGGIGKTTIAKAVYNSIAHQFEARCFLANVREISCQGDGLVKQQERLLYALLGNSRSLNVGSVESINAIKRSLCSKQVLLILDDVSELLQLNELAGDHNWFGPGSRIIITTRDQHLLTYHKVDSMYEVRGLDNCQAIRLFSWHAFKKEEPIESYVKFTQCIIGYAKGLPLALEVLGSYLYGRNLQEWESALKKYRRNPHKHIYEVLRISYDGLDDNEKDIFLDIACFFKGRHLQYVTEILDSCGFSAIIGITRLRDKCLINISGFFEGVEMHDLLQEMGKEIVRQESPKEVGKRSRLWLHKDVRHVLEENTGTNKIEGILLDFPSGHDTICLHSKAFMKMKRLRLFLNHNAQFSGGPNYLSNELRVLNWPKYPSSFLPSNFHGNKLTILRMSDSLVKELHGLQHKNLIHMDLSHCKFLRKIPDLSSSSNLKRLDLQRCENLVEIHHSIGFLDKLSVLLVNECCKLRIFPKIFKLRSLSSLELYGCSSLEDFPKIECEMVFLKSLSLGGTSIKELPSSIGNLTKLLLLNLNNVGIKDLPSSIGNLTKLQELYLNDTGIKELPSSIGNLTRLRKLNLNNVGLKELPSSIGNLTWLRELYARGCKNLVHLPSSIFQLHSLCRFKLDSCSQPINIEMVEEEEDGTQSIPSIVSTGEHEIASTTAKLAPILCVPKSLGLSLQFCCLSESNFFTNAKYFTNLGKLDLSGSDIVIFPPSARFDGLEHLCLNNCKQLKEILSLPLSIKKVEAHGCTSLESFAKLSKIFFSGHLKIDLYGCHKLLVNMRLPSWEERHSKKKCLEKDVEDLNDRRTMRRDIIFPGKRIPSWFSYRKEAHDSPCYKIDINGSHYSNDIEEIVFCVVFGFRFGINTEMKEINGIRVRFDDGQNYDQRNSKYLYSKAIIFDWMDSDHVWMGRYRPTYDEAHISSFRFECYSTLLFFRSVGVHFLKKHEEKTRDHIGEDDVGAYFNAFWEECDFVYGCHLGKRHRDEYDGNMGDPIGTLNKRGSISQTWASKESQNYSK
ncbi:disease resistance protein RUN1-like [Carya illinoinensis]|uniref:TMV resistance protein N n=1 Tax=Carya illinoinensis TaxID=32201 RepID=A0A8T1N7W7_CARIL|nr:disease resistance protein RUN1-like [Carya illinoinensis]XP_042964995.1 disease resistance protein RUN1-like [Carya illinoinensis]XP_042964996.1 disease resistance protein RUN1-like [Carya illinoinensis]XP_042964997.1 disease resistance protein RUN1-like [Carya illinoinensis]XP_042964998.1 disease resistance protein RUN1-like [Carya illinoinensis]XP_042964999.1 disease resistance protein RUN1-like [Carya illinoinensis]XP_042965000.1 disease resistance protein RUN1-like [Carya illinoinensi